MLFDFTYNQLKNSSKGIYKEKGSKFISYAFIVKSEKEANKFLNSVKKLEKNARHFCYAYVISPDKSIIKSNDDGEPSNTAGKPILGQINSNNLTNCLIVVVRYFGGIKLGITGLIRSYKNAAANAILNNKILTINITETYKVIFNYEETNFIIKNIKLFNAKIISQNHNENSELTFSVAKNKSEEILLKLSKNHKIKIEYIKTE